MLLSVKRLGSTREPYEVELFLNPPRLADLKEALFEKSGIPIWAQRVFHKGKCLRSTKTLEEQGLVGNGNCILHLAASAYYKAPAVPEPEPPMPPPQLAAASSSSPPPPSAAEGPPEPAEASPSEGAPAETPAEEDVSKLSVAELKQRLKERGVSFEGCTEKSDLVDLLRECIATGRWEPQPPPQEAPPRAANFPGPCLGPSATPFSFAAAGGAGGAPGQPANPLAALFSQIGPMVGTAMNQALAQAQAQGQQQGQPGTAGGAAIPMPPAGAAPPVFAAFPQEHQMPPQWGAGPPDMATLLQQLGPQLASQMGGQQPQQTQDFGDITFSTDMNFVMAPPIPMGVAASTAPTVAGAAPTVAAAAPTAAGTPPESTQPAAPATLSPLAESGSGDAGGEGGHHFL